MGKPRRILNLEDSERDSALVLRHLKSVGVDPIFERVDTAEAMKAALKNGEWDLILSDYSMPQFNALAALEVLKESGLDIPLIIISGTVGENVAVEAMRSGANDYLMKDNLKRLGPTIERELLQAENRRAQRQAEENRRQSEERYRTLFEYAPDGIIISGPDDYYLDANTSMCEMLGYNHKELIGLHARDIVIRSEVHELDSEFALVQASSDYNREWHFRRKDGSEFPSEVIATIMPDGNLLAMIRDISARKQAEEKLRESESLIASSQRITHLGSWVMDISDSGEVIENTERWSDEHYRIFGFEPGQIEITDEVFYNSVHPEDRERLANKVREAIEESKPFDLEHRIILPDGRERTVQAIAEVVLNHETGKPARIQGSVQDITDRKLTQAALAESEKRFRSVVETAPDVIVTIDDKSKIYFINRAAERIFGYSSDEMRGQSLTMLMPERLRCLHEAGFNRYLQSGVKKVAWEYVEATGLHKSGLEIPITISFSEYVQDGRRYFTGIIRDITERKQAMEALRVSEERYRELVENALDIIYTHDFEGNYTSVNSAAEKISGYTKAEVMSMNMADTIPADQIETARQMIAAKLAGEATTAYELDLITKDGRRVPVEVNTRIIYENGNPVGVQGIARDISERKAGEAARLASERKYQALFTLAPVGIYQSLPDGSLTTANAALARMLGYDSAEELLETNFANIYFDPDERRALLDKYELRGYATDIDLRWKKKDGEPVWIQLTAQAIKGPTGGTEYFEGFVRDITERKLAEKEIESTMQRLNAAQRIGKIGDWTWDKSSGAIIWSREIFNIVGRDPKLGPPRSYEEMQDYYGIESRLVMDDRTAAAMETGQPQDYELVVVRNDGKQIYAQAACEPQFDDAGKICGLRGTLQDVSARRLAEEALRESENRYHSLFENMIEGYAYCETIFEGDKLVDWVYTEVNGAFEGLTGMKDVVGKKISDLIPGGLEIHPEIFETYGRVALTGRTERFETYIEPLKRWLAITIYSSDREHFVGVFDNITERKVAEAKLNSLRERTEKRERMLTTMLSSMSDFAQIYDSEGRIIFVNQPVLELWGRTLDDVVGKTFRDLDYPEDLATKLLGQIEHVYRSKESITDETPFRGADGSLGVYEYIFSPAISPEGEVEFVVGSTRDVTERKMAADALAKSQEQLTLAAESVNLGVWDWDIVGNKMKWDDRMFELYGISEKDFSGAYEAWQKGLHPDDREAGNANIQAALSGERQFNTEFRVVWPSGEVHDIEARALVQRDDAGNAIRMIGVNWDITERKRAEAALEAAEENYRSIFENAVEGICQSTLDGRFISANPATARILGFDSPEELIAVRDISSQHYVDPATRSELSAILEEHGVVAGYEAEVYKKDGSKIWTQENIRAIRGADGQIHHYEGSIEDITARKSLEDQFRQSQKMEAVGVMAGGIAHDFNNLLTAINGYSDLTLRKMAPDEPLRRNLEEVKKAGDRAAELTSQLLAFSRKQVLRPVVHNLNSVVVNMENMLRRLIRENIELRTVLDADLGNIKADPGQIEQVIMNLAVNARDAMPNGGTLTIETQNVFLDDAYISQKLMIEPGPFTRLTVTDNGHGMDEFTQRQIFEPFFTTKDVGKGTGLGLSMVYGIVKQSGGDIMVYSEPGHGTTFKIFLPRVDEPAKNAKWLSSGKDEHVGTETILLVEDEEIVRKLVNAILTSVGYTVLEAEDGNSALEVCNTYKQKIDMLLTDIIMPKMSGFELKEKILVSRPDIKILFMSGYTDDTITSRGITDTDVAFIEKPFTPDSLSHSVREVLSS